MTKLFLWQRIDIDGSGIGGFMQNKLKDFVKNGGRIQKNREPKFEEPFYREYMEQFIDRNYNLGDKVKVIEKRGNSESTLHEGIIIKKSNHLFALLTSGKKVYKNKQNKKYISYHCIQAIELIHADDRRQ